MLLLAAAHCVALMLVLVPDTLNTYRLVGFELVANPRLNPVQLPEVDQVNVCGKVIEAPAEGLLNVAVQVALAGLTAPIVRVPAIANTQNKRLRVDGTVR